MQTNDAIVSANQEREHARQQEIRDRAKQVMVRAGVITSGHFRLGENGVRHSDAYFNPHPLFFESTDFVSLVLDLLELIPADILDRVDIVAGPATGGAIMANLVANQLTARRKLGADSVKFVPVSKDPRSEHGYVCLPYYANRVRGKRILLLDDIISTGATLHFCLADLKHHGAQVLALASFADRAQHQLPFSEPKFTLWAAPVSGFWHAACCPMCAAKIPFTRF